jgi:hypothetical protein
MPCSQPALRCSADLSPCAPQIPKCYEEPLLRHIHHSIGTEDELIAGILAAFQERLLPGEELSARAGPTERPCRLLSFEKPAAAPAGPFACSSKPPCTACMHAAARCPLALEPPVVLHAT